MFPTVSSELNHGKEVVAYSWNGLRTHFEIAKESVVCVPFMSIHTDPNVYSDFVCSLPGNVLTLPPVPKESLTKTGLYELKRAIMKDGHYGSCGGKPVDGVILIDLDIYATNRQKHISLQKSIIVLLNNDPVEEHGLHLPLDSDSMRARGLRDAVARHPHSAGKVTSVPSLSYVRTGAFERAFCGTVDPGQDLQYKMLVNYVSEVVRETGAEHIVIFTSHAHPYHTTVMCDAADGLREKFPNTRFTVQFDFDLLSGEMMSDGNQFETRGHASRCETSSIMAYLVDEGRAGLCDLREIVSEDPPNTVDRIRGEGMSPQDYIEYIKNGQKTGANGFGSNHPGLSTVEFGREYNDKMLERAMDKLGL